MHGARVGFACALLGALGFSFKAILVKTAYRYGVHAETLLASRMLYSLPFFIAMAAYAQWRTPYRFTARDWRELALLGFFGYYVSSYADFLGLQYVSAALERVLLYTFPTFVVIMTAIGKRERPTPLMVGALLLSYIGVALAVFHGGGAGTSNLPLGATLIFISALSMAIYLYRSGSTLQRLGATRVTAWATGIACVMTIVQFAVLRPIASLPAQPLAVHLCALGMAIFSTVLPIWLNATAIRRLGASRSSIVSTLGPIFTMLLAGTWLGEKVTVYMWIGALCVILGVRLVAMSPMPARNASTSRV
jgi:drug/metabolite transporter (DMT)-like permease